VHPKDSFVEGPIPALCWPSLGSRRKKSRRGLDIPSLPWRASERRLLGTRLLELRSSRPSAPNVTSSRRVEATSKVSLAESA